MTIWTTSLALARRSGRWRSGSAGSRSTVPSVIPVLHDQLGSALETGLVTQRVTDLLNLLGLVTIALGWIRTALERPRRVSATGSAGRERSRMLAVITLCLGALILLHRRLDDCCFAAARWRGSTRSTGLISGSAPSSGWPAWSCCRSGLAAGACTGSERHGRKSSSFLPIARRLNSLRNRFKPGNGQGRSKGCLGFSSGASGGSTGQSHRPAWW